MSVNKNFVVKNGLEVNTDLILADADTNKVGIASTTPRFTLDVRGGIGATDIIASGVGTFVTGLQVGAGGTILSANSDSYIGINTTTPTYLLDVRSSGSGVTAVYVQGGVEVTGLTTTQDLSASRNLSVSGVSTFYNSSLGNVVIGSGTTSLIVEGDARIVGILTIGTSSITLDGTNNTIKVGTGFTITSDGILMSSTGISTLPNLVSENAVITNINSSGISTLGITSVTNLTSQNINNSGIVTTNSLRIDSTQVISSERQLQNIDSLDATTTATIESAISNSPNTFTDLSVSGISTLGVTSATDLTSQRLNVSGISTISNVIFTPGASGIGATVGASVGIITYYGDGSQLQGVGSVPGSNTQVIYNNDGNYGASSNLTFNGNDLNVAGIITSSGLKVGTGVTISSGIVSATSFVGNVTGNADTATAAQGLTGTPNITVGIVTASSGEFSGNLVVSGGIQGIGIQSAGVSVYTGVVTALNFVGTGNTFAVNGTTVDISISGGGGAGVSSTGILTCRGIANASLITDSITLDDYYNAGTNYAMVGPIEVSVGATITVGAGVSYVVV